MNSSPIISIIVVSYNTCSMTVDCIKSVINETRAPLQIIVIDNASTDSSIEHVSREFPEVTCLAMNENHGFARANNIAAEHVKGEYLLLLNPDTVVKDRAIDRLLEFANANPQAKIWGGKTLFADGTLNPASCWREMSLWNIFCRTSGLTGLFPRSELFNAEAYGGWKRDSERDVDIVSGCFLLIRRKDWQALGGFNPAFVMYGEEADLCIRARKLLGANPKVTPAARIVHYGGASERTRVDKLVRLLRAKVELIDRHIPEWQRPFAKLLFVLWPLSRRVAYSFFPSREDSYRAWREVWQRRLEWREGFNECR